MKIKLVAIFVFIFISTFSISTYACSCGSYLSFKQAYDYEHTELVIHGRVLGYQDNSANGAQLKVKLKDGQYSAYMKIEVISILKGGKSAPTIVISGFGGMKCWRNAIGFPTGTEWLFAINAGSISSCGDFAVKIEDNQVITNYRTKEEKRTSLPDFYKSLGVSLATPQSSGARLSLPP